MGELAVDGDHVGQIEPTVQREHGRRRDVPGEGETEVVGVAVDDVEPVGLPIDPVEHADVQGQGVATRGIEPQGALAPWYEPRPRSASPRWRTA